MVALTGPLATASREPRQARKGATVVVTLCAEVWLVRVTAIIPALIFRLALALDINAASRKRRLTRRQGSCWEWAQPCEADQLPIVSLSALFIFLLSPYNDFLNLKSSLL